MKIVKESKFIHKYSAIAIDIEREEVYLHFPHDNLLTEMSLLPYDRQAIVRLLEYAVVPENTYDDPGEFLGEELDDKDEYEAEKRSFLAGEDFVANWRDIAIGKRSDWILYGFQINSVYELTLFYSWNDNPDRCGEQCGLTFSIPRNEFCGIYLHLRPKIDDHISSYTVAFESGQVKISEYGDVFERNIVITESPTPMQWLAPMIATIEENRR